MSERDIVGRRQGEIVPSVVVQRRDGTLTPLGAALYAHAANDHRCAGAILQGDWPARRLEREIGALHLGELLLIETGAHMASYDAYTEALGAPA